MFKRLKEACTNIRNILGIVVCIKEKIVGIRVEISALINKTDYIYSKLCENEYKEAHRRMLDEFSEQISFMIDSFIYITDTSENEIIAGGYLRTFFVQTTSLYNTESRNYDVLHKKVVIIKPSGGLKEQTIPITDNIKISLVTP